MNLIIDVGNTRAKVAVFENDTLIFSDVSFKKELLKNILKIKNNYSIKHGIISSVAIIEKSTLKKITEFVPLLILDNNTKVPFNNKYGTPKTLGVDRIANIAAAIHTFNHKNTLIIDAGTCITYDFVNKKQEYFGGAISPGIEMRYKSLHNFTAKLPLLKPTFVKNTIGNNTKNSIHSGVINGVLCEIKGIIKQYKKENKKLTVVLTGGDTYFLAERLKNSIFANPNFLLEGLNTILNYNIKND